MKTREEWIRDLYENGPDDFGRGDAAFLVDHVILPALPGWQDGEPPKPWRNEWFIAETIHGDKVVLRSLPDEYTYDYKTADETYLMARNVKRWMQFPDSQFIAPPLPALPGWQDISTAPKDGTQILAFARCQYDLTYTAVAQWADADEDFGSVAGWFWPYRIRPQMWQAINIPPKEDKP